MESIPPITNFDSYIKDILLLKITHKLETEYHGLINYTCCAIDSLSLFNLFSSNEELLYEIAAYAYYNNANNALIGLFGITRTNKYILHIKSGPNNQNMHESIVNPFDGQNIHTILEPMLWFLTANITPVVTTAYPSFITNTFNELFPNLNLNLHDTDNNNNLITMPSLLSINTNNSNNTQGEYEIEPVPELVNDTEDEHSDEIINNWGSTSNWNHVGVIPHYIYESVYEEWSVFNDSIFSKSSFTIKDIDKPLLDRYPKFKLKNQKKLSTFYTVAVLLNEMINNNPDLLLGDRIYAITRDWKGWSIRFCNGSFTSSTNKNRKIASTNYKHITYPIVNKIQQKSNQL